MTDLPPSYASIFRADTYADLPHDVKDQLQIIANLPEKAREAGAKAAEKTLAASKTIHDTLEEVKKLGSDVTETNTLFEQIRLRLVDVDDQKYEVDGKPIPEFAPEWKGYQETWTKIFLASRSTASETVTYLEDFLTFVLPNVRDADTDEKVKEAQSRLERFAEKEDPAKARGGEHSNDYVKLSIGLKNFEEKFNTYTQPVGGALKDAIKNEKGKLALLNIEINQCRLVVTALEIAFGLTLFGTATLGWGLTFSPLAPGAIIAILIACAIAAAVELGILIAKLKELNGLESQRIDLQAKIDKLIAQEKALIRLKANLADQQQTLATITGRIDQFALIWSKVASSATQLSKQLQLAHTGKQSLSEFKERVGYLEVNFTTLRDALDIYSTRTK